MENPELIPAPNCLEADPAAYGEPFPLPTSDELPPPPAEIEIEPAPLWNIVGDGAVLDRIRAPSAESALALYGAAEGYDKVEAKRFSDFAKPAFRSVKEIEDERKEREALAKWNAIDGK